MLSRRYFLAGGAASLAILPVPQADANQRKKRRKTYRINRKYRPQRVRYQGKHKPGTIVVDTANRFLYLVERPGRARRYGVGVGRAGLAFKGVASVQRKAEWPSWTPTQNMIRREPKKYARYANGLPGGINNPLGARALYLYRNGRDTYYRIHGTNEPQSIGRSDSSGCIRLENSHDLDLYKRAPLGTQVVVI